MQVKQLQDLEIVLSRFSVKRAFFLGHQKPQYFDKLIALHHYAASGFLKTKAAFGACFREENWPFPARFFDIILLENTFVDHSKYTQLLSEASRVLSDDGYLIVVQSKTSANDKELPFRLVYQVLKEHKLHKIDSHYYDTFKLQQTKTWLPCLLPESFSYVFNASFSKRVIPLSPLFLGTKDMVKLPGKYAIGMNTTIGKL
ncbi:methyltransferase domain-containing protein [Fastidiosibacter lacustris]|uniref:methyltransferase domain-containing protein n=1 Tax=Fastidiosibacter lacustris TaxID=2056695 RepID=UPI000E34F3A9|nr:class I SAM-dependent methyltransferase [Fastidiosibacter lacustris]